MSSGVISFLDLFMFTNQLMNDVTMTIGRNQLQLGLDRSKHDESDEEKGPDVKFRGMPNMGLWRCLVITMTHQLPDGLRSAMYRR